MGLAFLINAEDRRLLSERKVLKRDEYAAVLDADAVMQAARAEARSIVRGAAQQADEISRMGYEHGLARARSEYAQRLLEGAGESQLQLRALRASMANIIVKAVGQIVATADPKELVETALRRVDALIGDEQFATLRVHPSQAPLVHDVLGRLRDEPRWKVKLSIVADAALKEGACTVQTASGTLELGLQEQLQAVRRMVERERGAARG